ncbi:uncharacterized protein KY384_008313 [Bacidia gigantensis]|uniref:uncharacterized protein n=1 Tax=Bacidia gigantensis TaxID=2732470 RepID=UPI001D056880|nr:uncharacterized protein KY384_008313 [Bacidia gigantensis]KAG8526884.1 hypothetical protein KY384_008313 [Bacidia gigantensis]
MGDQDREEFTSSSNRDEQEGDDNDDETSTPGVDDAYSKPKYHDHIAKGLERGGPEEDAKQEGNIEDEEEDDSSEYEEDNKSEDAEFRFPRAMLESIRWTSRASRNTNLKSKEISLGPQVSHTSAEYTVVTDTSPRIKRPAMDAAMLQARKQRFDQQK